MAEEVLLLSGLLSDFYQALSLYYYCGPLLLPMKPCLEATGIHKQGVSQAFWTHTM